MNKNQKGFAPIIIILVIIVLAVIGSTSYYLLNKNSQAKQNFNNPSTQTQNNSNNLSVPTKDVQSYTACGCGCCPNLEPKSECLYHSKGDDIQKIIKQDKEKAQSPNCAVEGCSSPVKYSYCD